MTDHGAALRGVATVARENDAQLAALSINTKSAATGRTYRGTIENNFTRTIQEPYTERTRAAPGGHFAASPLVRSTSFEICAASNLLRQVATDSSAHFRLNRLQLGASRAQIGGDYADGDTDDRRESDCDELSHEF